jgi:hypothetical protein
MPVRGNRDSELKEPPSLESSEFPALPAPYRTGNIVEERVVVDVELSRALEESSRFYSAGEDPGLVRAVEESKAVLLEQQRALLAEFEARAATRAEEERLAARAARVSCTALGRKSRRGASRPVDSAEILGFFSTRGECCDSGLLSARAKSTRGSHHKLATSRDIRWERLPAPNIGSLAVVNDGAADGSDDQLRSGRESKTALLPSIVGVQHDQSCVSPAHEKLHIVMDAEDVGMLYGGGEWKARGVELALNYFQDRGHEVLAVVPVHVENNAKESCKSILRRIRDDDAKVMWTHPSALTCRLDMLEHAAYAAKELPAFLLSNHNFEEELANLDDQTAAVCFRSYISRFLISFEWLGNDLVLKPFAAKA